MLGDKSGVGQRALGEMGGGEGTRKGGRGGGRREASILTAMDSRIGGSVIQPLLAKWNEGSTVRVP